MSAALKEHKAVVRKHMGGLPEVYCSGCGMNHVRHDEKSANLLATKHNNLNTTQFKGYQTPPRGSEGESSN